MTDGDLICNFKKCRKVLSGTAYITRCSHAFCEEDGIKEIESQSFEKKCPACKSALIKSYDLVKVTLHPTDQFKSVSFSVLIKGIISILYVVKEGPKEFFSVSLSNYALGSIKVPK